METIYSMKVSIVFMLFNNLLIELVEERREGAKKICLLKT